MKYENNAQRAGRNYLGDWIGVSARKWPEKTALVFGGEHISYKELNEKSNRIANAMLNMGIKKGDVVSIQSHNCPQFVYLVWASARMGAVFSPLNFGSTQKEVVEQISDNEAKVVFVEGSLIENVLAVKENLISVEKFVIIRLNNEKIPEQWIDFDELYDAPDDEPDFYHTGEDPVALLYTSGTTGGMKGCVFTSNNLFAIWQNSGDRNGMNLSREDVLLLPAPLFTSTGYGYEAIFALKTGATCVMQYLPNPTEMLELIEKEKVSFVALAPTLWIGLLYSMKREYNFNSVKKAVWFGDSMNLGVLKKWQQIFPDDVIWSPGLGSTETGMAGFNYWSKEFPQSGSLVGKVHPNVEVRLVNENNADVDVNEPGECIVRGPSIMKSYHKRDEANKEAFRDGWFHTGDVLIRREDGLYYFFDRVKDMIKTGGLNVSCKEVEETLNEHPEVQSSAVFSAPHDYWIEGVVAAIIRKSDNLTEQDLVDFCKSRLANYKIPKKFIFVNELPVTKLGKVMKRRLREEYKDIFKK